MSWLKHELWPPVTKVLSYFMSALDGISLTLEGSLLVLIGVLAGYRKYVGRPHSGPTRKRFVLGLWFAIERLAESEDLQRLDELRSRKLREPQPSKKLNGSKEDNAQR